MIILAIETSCDDTCVAILEIRSGKLKIRSNVVSSQVKLHAKYGGVYPTLAKREHQQNLPIILKRVVKKADNPKINLIAVTIGPGLEPCLWVGVNFAKELAEKINSPIVPINHIEAHILANFIGGVQGSKTKTQNFPAICLVVSGGHTQLILMENFGKYKILGETRDDAAGECFDKVARILGLDYPGGPAIAVEAAKFQILNSKFRINLPRPMIYQKNYDFSFSGLKTAVLYNFKNQPLKIRKSKDYIQKMSAEVQQAVIDVLIYKTIKAAKNYKAKTIILGGGVTANQELRKQFKRKVEKEIPGTKYLLPDIKFSTDNAVMIALTAYFNYLKEGIKKWKEIEADANLRIDEKI